MRPRIKLSGISKRFGETLAACDVSLAVEPGEIHALLGENGAGKSTIVKIIFGLLQADDGNVFWDGESVRIADPNQARALGIGIVSQHFSLFERLTVLDNIALGLHSKIARTNLSKRIGIVSAAYGLPLDPRRPVWTLSVGERQRVEIVRCLLQAPSLLIMDEPTSMLTPNEANDLASTLRKLASEGCSVLYISHKLEEVRSLCHTATILRGGRVAGQCAPSRESAASLARMMIDAPVIQAIRPTQPTGGTRLEVRCLSLPPEGRHDVALSQIELPVNAGEIFGIAGIAGNGQRELFAALSGERLTRAGSIVVDGRDVSCLGPAGRRTLGIATIPEERNGHAAVSAFSLVENGILTGHHRMNLISAGLIWTGRARSFANRVIAGFGVRPAQPQATARSLSGGNLQRFVVGREISQSPRLLVVAQPTWGVDVAAATVIHQALFSLAAAGSAIVVLSQDLEELRLITDRIMVIAAGKVASASINDVEQLALLIGGAGQVAAH